jgi:hypothetical protein
MPRMADRDDQVDRREARRVQVWTAVIAALSPVAVALIGLAATGSRISSDVGPTPAPTVTVTVTTAASPVSGAQTSNSAVPNSEASNGSLPPTGTPVVRHAANGVKVAHQGDNIDLNAPADDPTWGAASADDETDTVGYEYGTLYFTGAAYVTLNEAATYRSCSTATGYADNESLDANDLKNKKTCLKLTTGRFGTIEVTAHESRKTAVLNLTIWES